MDGATYEFTPENYWTKLAWIAATGTTIGLLLILAVAINPRFNQEILRPFSIATAFLAVATILTVILEKQEQRKKFPNNK